MELGARTWCNNRLMVYCQLVVDLRQVDYKRSVHRTFVFYKLVRHILGTGIIGLASQTRVFLNI